MGHLNSYCSHSSLTALVSLDIKAQLSQSQFSEHDVHCHAHVGTTSLKVFTLRCLLGFGTTHALLFYCLINDHIIFSSLIMSTALDPLSRKIKEV